MTTIKEHISRKYPEHLWEIVSERSVRSIYRLWRRDAVEYYVKIYDPKALWEKARNFIRPRTTHEAFMLMQLKASGIPVPEVKEHITHTDASALITHAVFPAKNLSEETRDVQVSVMLGMCLNLVNHGYHFTDMHAGNIILDRDGNPFLVDAYEISPRRRITLKKAADLFAQAANIYCLSDEELDPYLKQVDAIHDVDLLRSEVHLLAQSQRRARTGRRVRRSFREGSFSLERRTASYRALVHRGCEPDLDGIIEAHGANLSERDNLYKIQDKTQLSRVGEYCVKSYRKHPPLTEPYAKRSWEGLLTLLFNDVPVADPVALVLFRDGKSMLITKALDDPDLDQALSSGYENAASAVKLDAARALGSLIGSMHKKGIYHADLKACNIKVSPDMRRFSLLDTDRVEQTCSLSREKRVRNLAQINNTIPVKVSRGIRMAFLEAYCSVTSDDPKDLFRKVWDVSRGSEVIYRSAGGDVIEKWPRRTVISG